MFQSSLSFAAHVDYVLKVCSHRIFLLKQLRAQGMPLKQLHTVFQAIILQRLAYALPAWDPFPGASTPYKRWSKCTMKKIGGKVFAGT